MDALLQPPVATAFDAISSTASAVLYLAVALAALARSPRDVRTRVFLATAVASAAPYIMTALLWARGTSAAFNVSVIALVALSLMMGSLALLHFTQVFPWRRPWIRSHGAWLYAGYVALPLTVVAVLWLTHDLRAALAGAAAAGSGGVGAVSAGVSHVTMPVIALGALPVPDAPRWPHRAADLTRTRRRPLRDSGHAFRGGPAVRRGVMLGARACAMTRPSCPAIV